MSSVLPAGRVAVPAVALEVSLAELVAKLMSVLVAMMVEAESVAILTLSEVKSVAVNLLV